MITHRMLSSLFVFLISNFSNKLFFSDSTSAIIRLYFYNPSSLLGDPVGPQLIKATSTTADGTFTQDTAFSWDNGSVSSTFSINGSLKTYYCADSVINVAT